MQPVARGGRADQGAVQEPQDGEGRQQEGAKNYKTSGRLQDSAATFAADVRRGIESGGLRGLVARADAIAGPTAPAGTETPEWTDHESVKTHE